MAKANNIDTKKEILDCLERQLETRSFKTITLSDIAIDVGISKGTLYYYYKTKDQILYDMAERSLQQQYNDFVVWITDENKDRSINRIIKYILLRDTSVFTIRLSLVEESPNNETLRLSLNDAYNRFIDVISKYTEDKFPGIDSKYLSTSLILLSDGILIQKKLNNPNVDIDYMIDYTANFFKKTLTE